MELLARPDLNRMKGGAGAIVFLTAFFLQQYAIDTPVTPIRPYMLVTLLALIVACFHVISGSKLVFRLVPLDYCVFVFYFFLLFTSLYAANTKLAVQMFFGVILLLAAYGGIRYFLMRFDSDAFYRCFALIAKFYFVSSFLLYLMGIFSSLYLERPTVLLGESEAYALSWGVYFEGGVIPRLRGVTDSPNNFAMYALVLIPIWFFGSEPPRLHFKILAVASVALTLSVSAYIAIALMIATFVFWRFRISSGHISQRFAALIVAGAVTLLASVVLLAAFDGEAKEFINNMIGTRLEHAATGSGRFELWQYCMNIISEGPLWGFGLNQERVLLAPLRNLQSVHNNIIGAYFSGGAMALFLYLVLLIQLAWTFVSKVLPYRERVWLSLCWISLFVFSNVNETLFADSFFFSLAIFSSTVNVFCRCEGDEGGGEVSL
ncbi:O-antigen ligase family protein [Permianibacter sp. IMCC34836]|uniref:O-antigen ligase family protein n=1 Tax=Permianibacter fluminis TaxID=2738515 RepID=UPI00155328E1|nr:O-antigen ligase family protein [Permianibacter fluminis]NQD37410.1 O-antigen ligase family protein [Permianibacter fluminis]